MTRLHAEGPAIGEFSVPRLVSVYETVNAYELGTQPDFCRELAVEIGVRGHRTATREGAQQFREALEELGTTFIKLGQLLSSRPDLLPDVYIEELGRLVDEVPPVPFAEIERIVREDFGDGVFANFDPEPLATASVAQTHRALLASGRDVVVKVRRPGIV